MHMFTRIKRIAIVASGSAVLAAGAFAIPASATTIVTSQPGSSGANQLSCAYSGAQMAYGEGQMQNAAANRDGAGFATGAINQMQGMTSAAQGGCQLTRV